MLAASHGWHAKVPSAISVARTCRRVVEGLVALSVVAARVEAHGVTIETLAADVA